jgi:hypothetical protein
MIVYNSLHILSISFWALIFNLGAHFGLSKKSILNCPITILYCIDFFFNSIKRSVKSTTLSNTSPIGIGAGIKTASFGGTVQVLQTSGEMIAKYGNRESVGGGVIEQVGRLMGSINDPVSPPNVERALNRERLRQNTTALGNSDGTLIGMINNLFK